MFKTNLAAINAARKQFGQGWKNYVGIEKLDGQWYVQLIQTSQEESEAYEEGGDENIPACLVIEREGAFAFPTAGAAMVTGSASAALSNAAAFFASRAPQNEPVEMPDDEMRAAQEAADRIANAQASEQVLPNGKVWIRQSSVLKPTKMVWTIADEMNAEAAAAGKPAPSRKEVQEECVRRGIASGTARTQYQAWKAANDATAKNAALAAELSAKLNGKG